MTLRSVRTLQAKLREQEDASIAVTRSILSAMSSRVEQLVVPADRPVRDFAPLIEILKDGYGQIVKEGVLLLRNTLEENMKSMGRDLKALESNAGPRFDGLARAAFEKIDGEEALKAYEEGMRSSVSAAFRLMVEELDRQRQLSQRYDEGAGLKARWCSQTPVLRRGRRGVGVIPAWDSAIHAIWVNWMYAMVNAQRDLVADEAEKILASA